MEYDALNALAAAENLSEWQISSYSLVPASPRFASGDVPAYMQYDANTELAIEIWTEELFPIISLDCLPATPILNTTKNPRWRRSPIPPCVHVLFNARLAEKIHQCRRKKAKRRHSLGDRCSGSSAKEPKQYATRAMAEQWYTAHRAPRLGINDLRSEKSSALRTFDENMEAVGEVESLQCGGESRGHRVTGLDKLESDEY